MMNSELVTVIIPTFNSSAYLEDCFKSVENQSYSNLEILIVDDGSTDATKELIDLISRKSSREVRAIYNSENRGPSHARNRGLESALGLYVVFLDSDDMMSVNRIESQLAFMNRYQTDITFSRFTTDIDEFKNPKGNAFLVSSINYIDFVKFPNSTPFPPSAMMAKRELFNKVGSWDESLRYAEDFDLLRRFAKAGFRMIGSSETLLYRRLHEQSATTRKISSRAPSNLLALEKIIKDDDSLTDSTKFRIRLSGVSSLIRGAISRSDLVDLFLVFWKSIDFYGREILRVLKFDGRN